MANVPTVELVHKGNNTVACVMLSATVRDDGFLGVSYWNYDTANGKLVGRGWSKGRGGSGMGSMLMCIGNAKRAAKRYLATKRW